MFEPFFDQYLPSITFNGGKPVYVPLHPPSNATGKFSSDDWKIDPEELKCVFTLRALSPTKLMHLRAAITPRTKMIIVNTPHNPVGKVFTKAELELIAGLAEEHNLLVMADEVVRASPTLSIEFSSISCSSTTVSYSMIKNTFGSLISLGCGIVQ